MRCLLRDSVGTRRRRRETMLDIPDTFVNFVRMGSLKKYLFLALLALCFGSCGFGGRGGRAEALLDGMEAQLHTRPDSAFVALDSLDRSLLTTPELKARHALLYSIALDKVGIRLTNDSIIGIAVDWYASHGNETERQTALEYLRKVRQNAVDFSPRDTLAVQQERMIMERYTDKAQLVSDRRSRSMLGLLVLIASAGLLAAVFLLRKVFRKLRSKPSDEAMAIISRRLEVLDKFLASKIANDYSYDRQAEEDLDKLVSDRDDFLHSTRVLLESSHPKFISYLSSQGLTDWEIGYCCLYALGLKGKEVGEYIQKKRHYIISSEIRRKLGLSEHDTNIGIWLRQQMLNSSL